MAICLETNKGTPLFIYPQSCIALYANKLYVINDTALAFLQPFERVLANYPDTVAEMHYWQFKPLKKCILSAFLKEGRISMYFITPRFTWTADYTEEHCVFLTPQMRKLQRTVRQWARKRIESRRLALAMGLHGRLGMLSGIQVLSSDLLAFLIK